MLVTFYCDAYEDITLFGSVAIRFLEFMHQSDVVPGAILAEDIPGALQYLKLAVAREKENEYAEPKKNYDDEQDEVPLSKRAIPLIALFEAANQAKCDVMWR
ncbi:MAG: hypothetical protein A3E88_05800 [Legionellales bacterium RIFCSPHIGHO2_12_FULL_35_11]|nr:MAG: hypothetical protein A3E88_05800 [Legionellales bacterium RIFCSPHIGHO2_12_FULL_35_11]